MTNAQQTPAGWYPEPATGSVRYWDGTAWTEQRAPLPAAVAGKRGQNRLGDFALAAGLIAGVLAIGLRLSMISLLVALGAFILSIVAISYGRRHHAKLSPAIVGLVIAALPLAYFALALLVYALRLG